MQLDESFLLFFNGTSALGTGAWSLCRACQLEGFIAGSERREPAVRVGTPRQRE